jgi:hypothetical protein
VEGLWLLSVGTPVPVERRLRCQRVEVAPMYVLN